MRDLRLGQLSDIDGYIGSARAQSRRMLPRSTACKRREPSRFHVQGRDPLRRSRAPRHEPVQQRQGRVLCLLDVDCARPTNRSTTSACYAYALRTFGRTQQSQRCGLRPPRQNTRTIGQDQKRSPTTKKYPIRDRIVDVRGKLSREPSNCGHVIRRSRSYFHRYSLHERVWRAR